MHSRQIPKLPLRAAISSGPNLTRFSVRNASTIAYENTSAQPSRWTRRLIYAGIFGSLGVGAGKWMDSKFAVPPLPGSIEDQAELQHVQRAYEIGLPIVQELRNDPDYTEKDVYGDFSDDRKTHRLTSGPLSGSRGLAFQVSGYYSHRLLRLGESGRVLATSFKYRVSVSRSWLTYFVFDRKSSGMTRRRSSLALSSLVLVSKDGQPWCTEELLAP